MKEKQYNYFDKKNEIKTRYDIRPIHDTKSVS